MTHKENTIEVIMVLRPKATISVSNSTELCTFPQHLTYCPWVLVITKMKVLDPSLILQPQLCKNKVVEAPS